MSKLIVFSESVINLQAHTCEHPIVIIKDVQAEQLRQMLQFMYSGEVNIHRQDLSAFLQTAELLQIKGLTTNNKVSYGN